jgi:NAD-dependent dihydropyrimidine dehydrogenase PreA subunit
MKRKIISIDENKCTGCGQCIPDCQEGALQLIDRKARLVSDVFCDGLGACIGTCPEGAISIIEREAVPYNEKTVMKTIANQGMPVIKAHLEHLTSHGQTAFYNEAIEYLIENDLPLPDHTLPKRKPSAPLPCAGHPPAGRMGEGGVCPPVHHGLHPFAGCPGSAARSISRAQDTGSRQPAISTGASELRQWPVQLSLLHPSAPYFDNADLLISADCVPFACHEFHDELLKGKILIIFCPKLDADIDGYIDKLAAIVNQHTIKSITLAHMEVPCCSGVRYVVEKALEKAGRQIPVTDKTISIDGTIR